MAARLSRPYGTNLFLISDILDFDNASQMQFKDTVTAVPLHFHHLNGYFRRIFAHTTISKGGRFWTMFTVSRLTVITCLISRTM